MNLIVKYGYIRLINTKADLCEQIKNVELECPIEKGKISITKEVDLPNEIPPVSFTPPNTVVCMHLLILKSLPFRASTRWRPMSMTRTTSTLPASLLRLSSPERPSRFSATSNRRLNWIERGSIGFVRNPRALARLRLVSPTGGTTRWER